jgi:hypothetical protein
LSSNIRKIAHDAESAKSERKAKTVAFSRENKLKLVNMRTSQKARIARKGVGIEFSDWTNSKKRVCTRSLLI